MYGSASSDLVNAKMADHHRYAKRVALESAARHSLRTERPAKRSWHSDFIAFATGVAVRLGDLRKGSAVQSPVATPRLKSAAG
jgi:hypothetical protein